MKKTFFKRAISIILTLVMILTIIPVGIVGVFADTADTGYSVDTDNKKITITTADGWNAVAAVSSSYRDYDITLGGDIDFSGKEFKVLFPATVDFEDGGLPGNTTEAFSGTFDGAGKTIKNITYTATSTTVGEAVIASVLSGTVKNLVIDNVSFTASAKSSAIVVGVLTGGTVSGVTVRNSTIEATVGQIGIVVGGTALADDNLIENSRIESCTLTATATSGGFAANLAKSININNCHATGTSDKATTVTVNSKGAVGMFIGKVNSGPVATIENCSTNEYVTVQYDGDTNDLVSTTDIDYARGVGLMVGQVGGLKSDNTDWSTLIVKKCTVGGTVTTLNGTKTNGYIGSVVGILSSSRKANLLEEITVTATVSARGRVGGMVGYFFNGGTLTVNKCNVEGTVTDASSSGSGTAGGVVGEYTTANTTGTINITNTSVTANVTSNEQYFKGLGGVIGVLGRSDAMSANINIENCYVAPSLITTRSRKAGGIIGYCSTGANTTIKINNVVLNVNTTDAKGGCGTISNTMNATLTKSNVASTVKDAADASIAVITEAQISEIITYESGYIKSVGAAVRCNLVQISNKNTNGTDDTSDDSYLIRFIGATIYTDITSAHMSVTVTTSEGAKTFAADCTVYDTLTGYNGTGVETYKATDFGANKFVAIVIKDMPADLFEGAEISVELTVNGTSASFVGTLPLNTAA